MSDAPGPGSLALVRLDPAGIELTGAEDRVLDVCLDGRRVWSFWSRRDTRPAARGHREVSWPTALAAHLDGRATVTVRDHVSGRVLLEEERSFGTGTGRVAVVGASGQQLGIDKSGRLVATFESRTAADIAPLLDALSTVLAAVEAEGLEPVVAYGTLLGAVREGRLLGHDSDADIAYVSRATVPVDVVRESFALQRAVIARGHRTYRHSGAAFRVDVDEGDGVVRGLDVFAGFFDAGRLYVMGEIGADLGPAAIWPRTTVQLEGRSFPAPADPDAILTATYGAQWRVPDPAFHFETPTSTSRRLTGWFRGAGTDRRFWQRAWSRTRDELPRGRSGLARQLARASVPGCHVVDVGAGRGPDSLWLARRGFSVTALDFVPEASRAARAEAAARSLSLEVGELDLTSVRSVLAHGARLAHRPGPRAVLARHVADATTPEGRDNLLRLASMALRAGGELHAQVWTGEGRRPAHLRPVPLDDLAAAVERHGGRVVDRVELPVGHEGRDHAIGRLVARWGPPTTGGPEEVTT